jgi:hypothetical protein
LAIKLYLNLISVVYDDEEEEEDNYDDYVDRLIGLNF